MRLLRPSKMTSYQYAKEMPSKTIRFEDVYEKYAFIEIFIKALDAWIRHSIQEYWRNKREPD